MSNTVTGRIVSLLPAQTGVGKNGPWVKQEFVIETEEQYPKKVCISSWGDKASNMDSYLIGEKVKVHYNLESREYNGKWFTEVKMWKIERVEGSISEEHSKPTTNTQNDKPKIAEESDDLPF